MFFEGQPGIKMTIAGYGAYLLEAKDIGEKGYLGSAIIRYWMSIEAFINELSDLLTSVKSLNLDGDYSYKYNLLYAILPEFEEKKLNVILRLKTLTSILTGKPVDTGQAPWQYLESLVKIRNDIAHARPKKTKNDDNGTTVIKSKLEKQIEKTFCNDFKIITIDDFKNASLNLDNLSAEKKEDLNEKIHQETDKALKYFVELFRDQPKTQSDDFLNARMGLDPIIIKSTSD